jgi:rfaE bifunctional protein kinase chain/domain
MKENLDLLFQKFNGLHIMVIGDIMADAYILGKVERISPEAPVPVINTKTREIRPGGAANVALNLKALGAKVTLCALVGKDEKGDELISILKDSGIDTQGIIKTDLRPTTVKTRVIAGGQHLLRIDDENDSPTRPEEKTPLSVMALKLVEKADAIIFEDYDKGTLFPELIETVISHAQQKGIPTTVDPKKRNFNSYKGVTLFKPNVKELKEGLGIEVNASSRADVHFACEKVMQTLGVQGVLFTLSEFGMAIQMGQTFEKVDALPRDIADVSGAGDTVISVATACLAAGCAPSLILQLSNMAGGLVCEHSGVVPIQKDKLLSEAKRLLFKA